MPASGLSTHPTGRRPPRAHRAASQTPPRLSVCVQIARLEEIRNSGTRELNDDELTKVGLAAAFRDEVRERGEERARARA